MYKFAKFKSLWRGGWGGGEGGGSNYANPVKTSNVSSTTSSTTAAQQASDLLKFYQILSDTTFRRTEVDQEDESDKR